MKTIGELIIFFKDEFKCKAHYEGFFGNEIMFSVGEKARCRNPATLYNQVVCFTKSYIEICSIYKELYDWLPVIRKLYPDAYLFPESNDNTLYIAHGLTGNQLKEYYEMYFID